MRLRRDAAVLVLALTLGGFGMAQTNVQENQAAQDQLKTEHNADKAQAKADKAERKALRSKKVKKAVKAQDKANREAEKVPQ